MGRRQRSTISSRPEARQVKSLGNRARKARGARIYCALAQRLWAWQAASAPLILVWAKRFLSEPRHQAGERLPG